MKKCLFIVPYFGKLPDFFPLFLKSAAYNEDFNWLILTNDMTNYKYPENVRVMYMSFNEFKRLVQSKFDFPISLESYQKLCDYKPAYGYILEDQIKDYDFWGYCDIDIILGKISDFITLDMMEKYDKLFELGHFSLIKNNFENNRLFMKKLNGISEYKQSFTTNKITIFDEAYGNTPNINDIFRAYNKKIFGKNYAFDVQTDKIAFQDSGYDYKTQEFNHEKNYKGKICVWNKGKLDRIWKEKERLLFKEYLYVHLQDRIIKWTPNVESASRFVIIPNYVQPLSKQITYDNFDKIPKFHLDLNLGKYIFNYKKAVFRNKLKQIKEKVCSQFIKRAKNS